jgi:retron-type reverse transcriptase
MMTPICSLENLHRQYLKCRRNKRNTLNALRFEYDLEANLVRLQEEIEGQTYEPSRSVCFVLKRPKLREIFAADFRDRVVHHILVDALENVWEPLFIHDSYACRKGKGTHTAVKRLQAFMRRVSRNGTRRAYFVHLDIRGFFLHINKEILYRIITKRIRDEKLLWLARTVIFHDCTKNFVLKGERGLLEKIPSHKTLFGTQNQRGLPIGNLASQFFANVYLNELDQFVKHHLKARYYPRYSDDFVLLHEDKERLLAWRDEIREFLQSRLRLSLNERRQSLGPVSNGVDFLGYIVRPDYLLVRRRVVNRLKARLRGYETGLVARREQGTIFRYDRPVLAELRATWASYAAHLKMAHTHRLRETLWDRFGWLREFLQESRGNLTRVAAAPTGFRGLRGQYRLFCRQHPGSLPVFQVGRFYEFYDEYAEEAGRLLGLRRLGPGRGFRSRCGFPIRLQRTYLTRLMGLGCPAHVVREEGERLGGVKMRRLAERWVPLPGPAVAAAVAGPPG